MKLRKPLAFVGSLAVTAGLIAGTMVAPSLVGASSHREAPGIAADPTADNTDLYAFVSPDKPDTVTIIANYIPLQGPAGGPNFFAFAEDVLYEIHVDNVGDAENHIVYQFQFNTPLTNGNTFLYNTGQLTSPGDPDWTMPQTYRVTRVENGKSKNVGWDLTVPPSNVGARSTPNYETALGRPGVHTLDNGGLVFAGQRDDPFFVDLGSIFDLGGLRPFNSLHIIPLPTAAGRDAVQGLNTHTIALQLPITDLTVDHKTPSGPGDTKSIIGVYASASRKQTRVLLDQGNEAGLDRNSGRYVQVSRLGQPLINEVIIPLKEKDRWNRSEPGDDGARFLNRYRAPELAGLVNFLYPATADVPTADRGDLVTVLLTGIKGLNQPDNVVKSDFLRLNMMIAPASTDPNTVNRLGAMAGQFDGYPNGRRLADDVVDIEIRAVACGYGDILAGALGLCNLSPNNQLGDGVDKNDEMFMRQFPYVAPPHSGYEVLPIQEGA
jgi:hypothetical protein